MHGRAGPAQCVVAAGGGLEFTLELVPCLWGCAEARLSCVPLCDLGYQVPGPSPVTAVALDYLGLVELTRGGEGQKGKPQLPTLHLAASLSSEVGGGGPQSLHVGHIPPGCVGD